MKAEDWIKAHFAEARPRALAALTRRFRDLDLAEEALATACMRALQSWPRKGLPRDPFAWLLTVAGNAALDALRRKHPSPDPEPDTPSPEGTLIEAMDQAGLRDDILRLLFICCHPDLPPQDQSALALRVVTGLSVAEIAAAFLVKPKAMEQRITRAKRVVGTSDIPYETPSVAERLQRLTSVMLMLYLLFNEGWSASAGEVPIKQPLCEEAIRLTRLLVDLYPGMAEGKGLLALMLFHFSRRAARVDAEGDLVRLEDQDRDLWDPIPAAEARGLLHVALRKGEPGPYQIQAAIAATHRDASSAEETDWAEIERLYAALYVLEPSPVIRLNQAAALAKTEGPAAALTLMADLAGPLRQYRWYHAMKGDLLLECGRAAEAAIAFQAALDLAVTERERDGLKKKLQTCE